MTLTEKELTKLRDATERMQRMNRHWALMRWFGLLVGTIPIGVSVFIFLQMEWLAAQNSYEALGIEDSELVSLVGAMVDIRSDLLRTELKMYISLIISAVAGLNIIVVTLISWRGTVMQRYWLPLAKHVIASQDEARNT